MLVGLVDDLPIELVSANPRAAGRIERHGSPDLMHLGPIVVRAMGDAQEDREDGGRAEEGKARWGKGIMEGDGILSIPFYRGQAKILDPLCSRINHRAWFPRHQCMATVPLPQVVSASCGIQGTWESTRVTA
jgi:hypothetical protein